MAVSYNSAIFLIVSLLSISFTLTIVNADLIGDVCSKAQKPALCLSALNADPRSKGANLEGLATISIDISQTTTTTQYSPTRWGLGRVICRQALPLPERAERLFPSDPRLRKIDISQKNAQTVRDLVNTLLKQATDPKLKTRYDSCLENYNDTVDDLGELPGFLKSKDYLGLNVHASAAFDGPSTCDDNFSETPPAEAPELKDASDKLQGLIDIILVISNLLKG